ncbi:hypothetical protein Tco_1198356 [Tanacetum coccineum]
MEMKNQRNVDNNLEKHDNVQLDDNPMKTELLGTNIRNEVAAMPFANYGNQNGASRRGGIVGRLICGNRAMRPPGNKGSGGAGGGSRCQGRGRGRGGDRVKSQINRSS